MRLLSYALMPNHWHLVVWPRHDGELSTYAQWLTVTHVPRGGKVTAICHGGGCPFSVRTFAPHHGVVLLAPLFRLSQLE